MVERITLVLDPAEMAALRTAAQTQLRRPRDQARVILRGALGLQSDPITHQEMHNGGAIAVQAERAAVAA